ncbi:MAG: HlyC/CorC family transporter [Oscillospiraceae bacterium]|nr:HlyC/CorC family transporter [Oscillospiraceae bacterium]
MNYTTTILIIAGLVLLSMYFSATETAMNAVSRIRLKSRAENEGSKKAARVLRLLEKYDEMLSTILIGNNLVNIACTSLATLLFVALLKDEHLGATVATAVVTVVLLIFGEISPKSIAKENPERIAMFAAPLLQVMMVILTPINWIFKLWQKGLARIFKSSGDSGITEQELLTIVDEAEQGGNLDADESELIRSAIEFNELEVRDIFTPRIDIEAISVDCTRDEVARVFSESGYSRLPVYEGTIDNIIGIIYMKDFFNQAFMKKAGIHDYIKPVIFVPKSKKISDLRKELQEQQMHIAVVMDEFGCTVGIVTLEDILEELVGEIWDEHDEVVREITKTGDQTWVVSGKANVEKVFEVLDLPCEFEAMTVSGWVMEILEKIPAEGDSFQRDSLQVRVLKMYGKRIEQVEIIRSEQPEAAAEACMIVQPTPEKTSPGSA